MDGRRWHEAEALMANSTAHRHKMLGASGEDIGRRTRDRYPDAVTVLVREREIRGPLGDYMRRARGGR